MKDVECPYCGKWQEINHDDGYGYTEDETFEQQCDDCSKVFAYTTSVMYNHEASKADCLNGGKHKLEPVWHTPKIFPDWVRCSECGYEEKGEFDKSYFEILEKSSKEVRLNNELHNT